jgi:hypothetical protein
MAFLNEYGVAQLWGAMKERLSGAFNKVDFDVAEAASNLVSGDSIPTAFGKLAKNYSSILTSISDLNTSLGNRISKLNTDLTSKINTKLNKSDVLANYTTTATGKALDASLGPAIKSKMDLVDSMHSLLKEEQYVASSGYVDLKSYTSNNMYTFPADGYVYVDSGGSAVAGTHIWTAIRTSNNVNCASINMHVQGSYQTQSICVRKGMKFFVNQVTATNSYSIVFVPLDK